MGFFCDSIIELGKAQDKLLEDINNTSFQEIHSWVEKNPGKAYLKALSFPHSTILDLYSREILTRTESYEELCNASDLSKDEVGAGLDACDIVTDMVSSFLNKIF